MMNQEEALKKLGYFLQGNESAIDFCLKLNYVGELWDDLVDGDQLRSEKELNRAFEILAVEFYRNAFYRQYAGELIPLIQDAINSWKDSNVLKNGSYHDKELAYSLKQRLSRVYNYCAFLIGGRDWYELVGADMCRMHEETMEDYMEEQENGLVNSSK